MADGRAEKSRPCLGIALLAALFASVALAAEEPPPGAVLAELPFLEAAETNRILVDLAPREHRRRLRLTLDTGASFSVLTPLAARAAGVHVRRLKSTPYRRPTLLGRQLEFRIDVQSSDTASRTGWEYGLLGGNFLREYVVELDFRDRRVRILDPGGYRVPEAADAADETVLPIRLNADRPEFRVELNGASEWFLLDTGSPFGLIVGRKLGRDAGLDPHAVAGLAMRGVYGAVGMEFAEVQRVRVGKLELPLTPTLVATGSLMNQTRAARAVVGFDLLSQFWVRIDYPRGRLWLRRRPDVATRFLGEDYAEIRACGALFESRGAGLVTGMVFPESPASRRGLLPGDRVVRVDGVDGPIDSGAARRGIREGRAMAVERRDGDHGVEVELPSTLGAAP